MKKIKYIVLLLMVGLLFLFSACAQTGGKVDAGGKEQQTPVPALADGLVEVTGVVTGGGDQTPEDLMDAPRVFLYQVKLESGEEINLTYTVFPPMPSGEKSPVDLDFTEGEITVGQSVRARGTYDAKAKTLTLANEGDFIKTFKP